VRSAKERGTVAIQTNTGESVQQTQTPIRGGGRPRLSEDERQREAQRRNRWAREKKRKLEAEKQASTHTSLSPTAISEERLQHQKYQEVALKFSSKNIRAAAGILFDRDIPHWLVGDNTVILSSEHTTVFKPLKPTISEVLSAGDLPPEEIAKLRREHLTFHDTSEQRADQSSGNPPSEPPTQK
jgi:hypothetical protein